MSRLGPDGLLYVATADSIWTMPPVRRGAASASASSTAAAPSPRVAGGTAGPDETIGWSERRGP